MVKHIKKNYAKDGKLTKREKSIAYATAWKHHNEEVDNTFMKKRADQLTPKEKHRANQQYKQRARDEIKRKMALKKKGIQEVKFPKDYDPPKSWSKPPSGKELNKMAKYYAKQDKKIKEGKLPIISPGLEMPDMAIVKNRVKKKIDKKWEELKDTHRLHQEEIEYHSAMGPGSHEWGTDIGTDYMKSFTPGQHNPKQDPIKPLPIQARKPEDEKGVKITEGVIGGAVGGAIGAKVGGIPGMVKGAKIGSTVGDAATVAAAGYGAYKAGKGVYKAGKAVGKGVKTVKDKLKKKKEVKEDFDLDGITPKQGEYSKEQYPIDNEVDAKWAANVDGILTGAYEGGEITWEDVKALEKEVEAYTFDDAVEDGLYDSDEIEMYDFDGNPLNDIEITEALSVQGRMKRRFAARRNRQKLRVARRIALRRGSTPDRLKRRATRGARLMVYKRLLRGRNRANLPPAEKARLERMITRFQPLVNRISVKLLPQMRRNEIKRLTNRGKMKATRSKKYKMAKPVRSASSQKAKRYAIKKPGKFKPKYKKAPVSRIKSGGPTLKKASKAYKAFSYSVG